ncbi:MAG: hypothetical protein FWC89_08740 [Defluviitaleaceae bacterium]|nr:hypothetical protein [Defluviitaleaceae bacterium]
MNKKFVCMLIFILPLLAACGGLSIETVNDNDELAETQEVIATPAPVVYRQNIGSWNIREAPVMEAAVLGERQLAVVGEVEVSRTSVIFTIENQTDVAFWYGSPWEMAFFSNGRWLSVSYLTNEQNIRWTRLLYTLQRGGVKQYQIDWSQRFGELPAGRYMIIREGLLSAELPSAPTVGRGEPAPISISNNFLTFEFVITEDSPSFLPSLPEIEWIPCLDISINEVLNVTPSGVTLVLENNTAYDIDGIWEFHSIVPMQSSWFCAFSGEVQFAFIPSSLPEGYWSDTLEIGLLPSNGTLEFLLGWSTMYGEIPSGEYRMSFTVGGRALPPHATGAVRTNLSVNLLIE